MDPRERILAIRKRALEQVRECDIMLELLQDNPDVRTSKKSKKKLIDQMVTDHLHKQSIKHGKR